MKPKPKIKRKFHSPHEYKSLLNHQHRATTSTRMGEDYASIDDDPDDVEIHQKPKYDFCDSWSWT